MAIGVSALIALGSGTGVDGAPAAAGLTATTFAPATIVITRPPVVPPVVPVILLPNRVAPPVVIGSARPGSVLYCDPGVWNVTVPTSALSFVWEVAGITSGTKQRQTVQVADLGKSIRCIAYRTTQGAPSTGDKAGTVLSDMSSTVRADVVASSPMPLSPVTLSGAQVGQSATCGVGRWSGAQGYTFRWRRAGLLIPGAARATLLLPASSVGLALACEVLALSGSGANAALSGVVFISAAPATGEDNPPPPVDDGDQDAPEEDWGSDGWDDPEASPDDVVWSDTDLDLRFAEPEEEAVDWTAARPGARSFNAFAATPAARALRTMLGQKPVTFRVRVTRAPSGVLIARRVGTVSGGAAVPVRQYLRTHLTTKGLRIRTARARCTATGTSPPRTVLCGSLVRDALAAGRIVRVTARVLPVKRRLVVTAVTMRAPVG